MEIFAYLLPVLGCVAMMGAMMGAMMWMMRGRGAEASPAEDRRPEIDALRAEVESLRQPTGENRPEHERG
jgi:flagellar basal body-associated protein FliL